MGNVREGTWGSELVCLDLVLVLSNCKLCELVQVSKYLWTFKNQ